MIYDLGCNDYFEWSDDDIAQFCKAIRCEVCGIEIDNPVVVLQKGKTPMVHCRYCDLDVPPIVHCRPAEQAID